MTERKDQPFQMRASEEWLRRLDDWRRTQPDIPSRAEAIRLLVDIGLNTSKPAPAPAKRRVRI